MDESVYKTYGNIMRVRACGLCLENERLLMVNHAGIRAGDFWAPPGGGVEFGESMRECLAREFDEETGLTVTVKDFRFIAEFISPPLHAIEMFFLVQKTGGLVKTGLDPELTDNQMIKAVKWMTWNEIQQLDKTTRHGIFNLIDTPKKILDLKGHFKL